MQLQTCKSLLAAHSHLDLLFRDLSLSEGTTGITKLTSIIKRIYPSYEHYIIWVGRILKVLITHGQRQMSHVYEHSEDKTIKLTLSYWSVYGSTRVVPSGNASSKAAQCEATASRDYAPASSHGTRSSDSGEAIIPDCMLQNDPTRSSPKEGLMTWQPYFLTTRKSFNAMASLTSRSPAQTSICPYPDPPGPRLLFESD